MDVQSETTIRLRPAVPKDASLLRHWDEQQHVVDAAPNEEWDWDAELGHNPELRELLIVEADGRPIGFVQLIDPALEETHYWGDVRGNLRALDTWIGEEEDLGHGYGTVMMRLALERSLSIRL